MNAPSEECLSVIGGMLERAFRWSTENKEVSDEETDERSAVPGGSGGSNVDDVLRMHGSEPVVAGTTAGGVLSLPGYCGRGHGRHAGCISADANGKVELMHPSRKKVMDEYLKNPHRTVKEIAEALGKSAAGTCLHLCALERDGYIKRVKIVPRSPIVRGEGAMSRMKASDDDLIARRIEEIGRREDERREKKQCVTVADLHYTRVTLPAKVVKCG